MAKRRGSLVPKSVTISRELSTEDLQEKIRQRAYELYELRGGEEGLDVDDWLKAESEVTGIADRR